MNDDRVLKPVRTTVHISLVVWDMATDLMEAEGFNGNFSQFVGSLIREKALRVHWTPKQHNGHNTQLVIAKGRLLASKKRTR